MSVHTWQHVTALTVGSYLDRAVKAGVHINGSDIYVGRATCMGDLLPAKVIPDLKKTYVCYGGREVDVYHFEIYIRKSLSVSPREVWAPASHGQVPTGALQIGQTSDGEPLYMGRTHHKGSLTPGKIHGSHGCLYIPFGGRELNYKQYEVLVKEVGDHLGYYWQLVNTCTAYKYVDKAILAGIDIDGSEMYVGRAEYCGSLLPCCVFPEQRKACVTYEGKEIYVQCFEMYLKMDPKTARTESWIPANHGQVPLDAVEIGQTSSGEPLYMGRVRHKGAICPGRIHGSHGCMYVPFRNRELMYKHYSVLVLEEPSDNCTAYVWQQVNTNSVYSYISKAIRAGIDLDGSDIYVGRGRFNGDLLPCKVIPSTKKACISHSGREIELYQFEIFLREGFKTSIRERWVPESNGRVPAGAVKVGKTKNGEPLYMGRARHEGTITPGKIVGSKRCLYIPYGYSELSYTEYEVLILEESYAGYVWQQTTMASVSSHLHRAVKAGVHLDGSDIYVGRAHYQGDLLPCTVIPNARKACVTFDGEEKDVHSFELYIKKNGASMKQQKWIPDRNGHVPSRALEIGQTADGEVLYIGRVRYEGAVTTGKIQPSHRMMYIPFRQREVAFKEYETLVIE